MSVPARSVLPVSSSRGVASACAVLILWWVWLANVEAQFPSIGTGEESGEGEGTAVPVEVPSELVGPALNLRAASSDRFAKFFNAELRDIDRQKIEILERFEKLPSFSQRAIKPVEFGYHSGDRRVRPKWVQVDLGEVVEPDAIALVPVAVQFQENAEPGYGFPLGFRVDISEEEDFASYETVMEYREGQKPRPQGAPVFQEISGYAGRYVRVTVTRMWSPEGRSGAEVVALGELMVLKGARNLAVGKEVRALDTTERSTLWSRRYLTDGRTILGIPQRREPSPSYGYFSRANDKVTERWVQVDLEEAFNVDEVRLIPANPEDYVFDMNIGFPTSFRVEVSNSPDMRNADLLARYQPGNLSNPGNNPVIIPVDDGYGRYVRVTAERRNPGPLSFALAELQVYAGNTNVALEKTVTAKDSLEEEKWAKRFLVDGYSSRARLSDWQPWLRDLTERGTLIEKWRDLTEQEEHLIDETLTRGVTWAGGIGAGVVALFLFGLVRARQHRRKEVEAIRQQIASDLHDDIGSNLSSIALLAELGVTESGDEELAREEFREIKLTADRTVESMKDIVWMIRPGQESWKELVARFRETAAQMLKAHEYQFHVRVSRIDDAVPLDFKRDLFLLFKEVLNNIVKHAQAGHVRILLEMRRGRLLLEIHDDGRGFDEDEDGFRAGNGLRNLRRRAHNLGGKLKVESRTGDGTTVHLTAPVS